ncbi:MAG: signal peptidase I [Rubrobacter sp.]|nr:signal peptidase I [Rubrobacter sp.]
MFGFVKPVVADSRYVGSGSMIPTLKVGHGTLQQDRVLVNKLAYDFGEPERGDIALFESVEGGEDDLIKRVIAVEGDIVEIRHGILYLNGRRQEEPYLKRRPEDHRSFGPGTVPENHIFVMGDNRAISHDSRFFGPVPEEKLIGEAVLRYWPVDRVGRI